MKKDMYKPQPSPSWGLCCVCMSSTSQKSAGISNQDNPNRPRLTQPRLQQSCKLPLKLTLSLARALLRKCMSCCNHSDHNPKQHTIHIVMRLHRCTCMQEGTYLAESAPVHLSQKPPDCYRRTVTSYSEGVQIEPEWPCKQRCRGLQQAGHAAGRGALQ